MTAARGDDRRAGEGHYERATETTVADLTRDHFGRWVDVPTRGASGYLYAIHDDYNDGYPSRTLVLVEDSGAACEEEFSDSNPAGYPKTMGTFCTAAEDQGQCAGQLDLAEPYDRQREELSRDLLRAWADAASNAGCPPAFVARMRTFADMHDRHAQEADR